MTMALVENQASCVGGFGEKDFEGQGTNPVLWAAAHVVDEREVDTVLFLENWNKLVCVNILSVLKVEIPHV